MGNRLTENRPAGVSTAYSYDSDDRLLTARATSYTFDHNGNQMQAGARTFVWDLANRLRSTTLSGTTTSYTYTGDGRRVSASTGAGAGKTTSYLWDVAHEVPQVALERDGAGALLRRYTYGLDRLALSTPSASLYYHYDDLRVVANNLKFTGEQHDPTGLIHLRSRQYVPWLRSDETWGLPHGHKWGLSHGHGQSTRP